MFVNEQRPRSLIKIATVTLIFILFGSHASVTAELSKTDREFIELQTSINATMVAIVDWAAHEIWEAGYAETLTGRNWLATKQYALQLLASGTLVSLGGNGKADMGWVNTPLWQEWSSKMIEETKQSIRAIDARDQAALRESGERLIQSCEGCHAAFKPDIPTEGILHVPHHDYGDPLTQ